MVHSEARVEIHVLAAPYVWRDAKYLLLLCLPHGAYNDFRLSWYPSYHVSRRPYYLYYCRISRHSAAVSYHHALDTRSEAS